MGKAKEHFLWFLPKVGCARFDMCIFHSKLIDLDPIHAIRHILHNFTWRLLSIFTKNKYVTLGMRLLNEYTEENRWECYRLKTVLDNLNLTMSLRSTMKLHQSTWILTSPNLSTPTGTIPGAVQPIFLFQKLRVSSAILLSIRVLGNGICYQLKSKPAKLILNLKRQSKATFCPNYVLSFISCRYLISKI